VPLWAAIAGRDKNAQAGGQYGRRESKDTAEIVSHEFSSPENP
jgi:hypothetical protein